MNIWDMWISLSKANAWIPITLKSMTTLCIQFIGNLWKIQEALLKILKQTIRMSPCPRPCRRRRWAKRRASRAPHGDSHLHCTKRSAVQVSLLTVVQNDTIFSMICTSPDTRSTQWMKLTIRVREKSKESLTNIVVLEAVCHLSSGEFSIILTWNTPKNIIWRKQRCNPN